MKVPDLLDLIFGDELEEEIYEKQPNVSKGTMQVKKEHFYSQDNTIGLGYRMVFVDLDSVNKVKDFIKLEYDYLKKYRIDIYSKINLMDERLPSELYVEFSKPDEEYARFTVEEVEKIDGILKEIFKDIGIIFVTEFKGA